MTQQGGPREGVRLPPRMMMYHM